MPVPKKRTISTSEAAKVESSDHKMPDEQEFRQRMRNLAVSAMRVLIEEVMREEQDRTHRGPLSAPRPRRTVPDTGV